MKIIKLKMVLNINVLNLNKNWYENSFLLGAIVIISSLYYPHLHKFNFLKGLNLKIKYFKIID